MYVIYVIPSNHNMLTGKGSEAWMKKSYEEKRRKALKDRRKFDEEELEYLEISFPKGGGRTKPSTYKIKQFPFPTSGRRKVIDIRTLPWIGD
ncbi:MAG: hypothetical protein DRP62_00080 [Planctomycetota bacterium]|nr:MAG: hypothetical protein DRP62_00080 [Planctomycetota bacterium]